MKFQRMWVKYSSKYLDENKKLNNFLEEKQGILIKRFYIEENRFYSRKSLKVGKSIEILLNKNQNNKVWSTIYL